MIPCCILVIEDDDDREFMASLFINYNRLMYHEIFQIVHDMWVTEDLMQETLEKLIDKVKDLRGKSRNNLVNYIVAASRNHAKNYLRNVTRHATFSLDDEIGQMDMPQSDGGVELKLIRECDMHKLAQIWQELDERSRYLLEGRYILEKTNEEMARELGIKTASIRMSLTRARRDAFLLMHRASN